jgi:hypothetical protein
MTLSPIRAARGLVLCATAAIGCTPVDRDFDSLAPEPFTPPEAPPVVVDAPTPLAALVPASSMPGFFSCADACSLVALGACADLALECGLDCAAPYDLLVDDPCAGWGGFELVASGDVPPESCTSALWLESLCGGNAAAYCCTTDGSPIGE